MGSQRVGYDWSDWACIHTWTRVCIKVNGLAIIIINQLYFNKNILANKQYLKVEKEKTNNLIESGVRDKNKQSK